MMNAAEDLGPARARAIEWPTWALIAFVYTSWLALTWYHAQIPLWLWFPWAIWTAAWWGSVQHEIIHGHPTRNVAINSLLGMPPFWLWLPYGRYRQTHLIHHRDERLTDPFDDPEARYVTPDQWAATGAIGRAIIWTQTTLAGRILLGPFVVIPTTILSDWRAIFKGNRDFAVMWLHHILWLIPTLLWVFVICGVPVWQYALAFVHLGLGVAMIRSFAEHRAMGPVGQRTAIVENGGIFALLFLYNSLHVVHHRWPGRPWYDMPKLYAAHRDEILADNGGLVYDGYGDLFGRYLFRAHDNPVHRLGRAPLKDGTLPS